MLGSVQAAKRAASVCIGFLVGAGPVLADVTPDDVWLNWQNLAKSQGQTISATSAETDGDTLTLSGVTLSINNEFGTGSAALPDIDLQDNGDGTVAILLPDSFTVRLTPPKSSATQTPAPVDLNITAAAADIIASGVPDSINYQQNLPKFELSAKTQTGTDTTDLTLKLTDVAAKYLSEAGESGQNLSAAFASSILDVTLLDAVAAGETQIKLSLNNLDGKMELTGLPAEAKADPNADLEAALAAGMTFDASLAYGIGALDVSGMQDGKPMKMAGTLGGGSTTVALDAGKFHSEAINKALSLNVSGTDQAAGGDFTFNGAMADFATSLDIKGQGWSKSDDINVALKAGLIMAGTGALGSTNVDYAGGPADGPVKLKGALAGMQTSFALSAGQVTTDLDAKAITMTLASPDIPLPELTLDLGQLAFAVVLPVAKSDTPAPFSFLTRIVDLKLPQGLWTMFDPTGSLPTDPASLIIDTKGTVTLTQDLMDDAVALENGMEDSPGLLNSLDIPQILLRAAGAEVTAKGGFTFDNSDTQSLQGMPMPTGKIDIRATGVNTLVDKLVSMGLLAQDQVMQGRMMLSMFANTSTTADEITSTLEFKDKGFFANGQQLQ
ncbi:MAG: DUF2125 domain-containing protein [Alphaproteobacteria bacterium]